jgi:hypothetical protein
MRARQSSSSGPLSDALMHRRLFEEPLSAVWLVDLGFLLWSLDFRITLRLGGVLWGWDLLNDSLGMLLCGAGLGALCRLSGDRAFRTTAGALAWAAAVAAGYALLRDLDPGAIEPLAAALPVLRWAGLVAIAVFCLAMKDFCSAQGAQRAAESWIITLVLFLIASSSQPALVALASLLTAERPIEHSLPAVLLALAVNCVPVVHAFVSTGRMTRRR